MSQFSFLKSQGYFSSVVWRYFYTSCPTTWPIHSARISTARRILHVLTVASGWLACYNRIRYLKTSLFENVIRLSIVSLHTTWAVRPLGVIYCHAYTRAVWKLRDLGSIFLPFSTALHFQAFHQVFIWEKRQRRWNHIFFMGNELVNNIP